MEWDTFLTQYRRQCEMRHVEPVGSLCSLPSVPHCIEVKIPLKSQEACALFAALQETESVSCLRLAHCLLDAPAAFGLADLLKITSTVAELDLRDNRIGDDGAVAIAEALALNFSLSTLLLDMNFIGDHGVEAIAQALRINESLTHLSLATNHFESAGVSQLSMAVEASDALVVLDLRNNFESRSQPIMELERVWCSRRGSPQGLYLEADGIALAPVQPQQMLRPEESSAEAGVLEQERVVFGRYQLREPCQIDAMATKWTEKTRPKAFYAYDTVTSNQVVVYLYYSSEAFKVDWQLLLYLESPFVVSCLAQGVDPASSLQCIVTERAFVSLQTFIDGDHPVAPGTTKEGAAAEILECMHFLREKGMVHTHLQPSAFLRYEERWKIVPLGAVTMENALHTAHISRFMAPEVAATLLVTKHQPIRATFSAALWSLGLILLSLFCGEVFSGLDVSEKDELTCLAQGTWLPSLERISTTNAAARSAIMRTVANLLRLNANDRALVGTVVQWDP